MKPMADDSNRHDNRSGRAPYPRLVGDVGGTHARFGWVQDPDSPVADIRTHDSADHAGFEAVLRHDLAQRGRPAPPSCAVGVATPVTGDRIAMTNRDWAFSIDAVRKAFGFERFEVINDFAALALAVPGLGDDERRPVGGGRAAPDAPLAILGPGTGLGMAGLTPARPGLAPVVGEGGHASLAGTDAREDAVIAILRRRFGHASAERALSGGGLVNLYRACCELAGTPADDVEPSEVTARAGEGGDARCVETVDLFFALLGSVAGNLALILGARGGVYVGGGIVPQLGDRIDRSTFRERFEAKGRYREYLASIPTWLITTDESPALRGADRALDR